MQSPIPIGNPPITQDWLGIWYKPLPGEPAPGYGACTPWFVVPQHPHTDPFALAQELVKRAPEGAKVYLFVPGTRFDRFGTRHGRGGGWYDRFLSALPKGWLRIGVVAAGGLSPTPLERKPWDQPMDWLITR